MIKILRDKKIMFLFFLFFMYLFLIGRLKVEEEKLYYERPLKYSTDRTRTLEILGIKRAGLAFLWVKQTLNFGETLERDASEDIEKTALEIASLNPYFKENYYSSSVVLGLIKVYNHYDKALNILEVGMKYNLTDKYMKSYYGGIGASSKGDDKEVIKNFEAIIEKYKDPQLINILINLYESRYEKFSRVEDKKKLVEYLIMLYNINDSRYQKKVEEKLKSFKILH